MQQKYDEQDILVIGANEDVAVADAADFPNVFPVPFRSIRNADGELTKEFGVIGMHGSYVIDRNGKDVAHHFDFNTSRRAEYEATFRNVLKL